MGDIFSGIIIGILVTLMCSIVLFGSDYKKGQIDAINGKIRYELQVQPDNSQIWVSKSGVTF